MKQEDCLPDVRVMTPRGPGIIVAALPGRIFVQFGPDEDDQASWKPESLESLPEENR